MKLLKVVANNFKLCEDNFTISFVPDANKTKDVHSSKENNCSDKKEDSVSSKKENNNNVNDKKENVTDKTDKNQKPFSRRSDSQIPILLRRMQGIVVCKQEWIIKDAGNLTESDPVFPHVLNAFPAVPFESTIKCGYPHASLLKYITEYIYFKIYIRLDINQD